LLDQLYLSDLLFFTLNLHILINLVPYRNCESDENEAFNSKLINIFRSVHHL